MPGVLQSMIIEQVEVQTEEEGIALALAMCPPGKSIEIHAPWCDVFKCTCVKRVITKPDPRG